MGLDLTVVFSDYGVLIVNLSTQVLNARIGCSRDQGAVYCAIGDAGLLGRKANGLEPYQQRRCHRWYSEDIV